MIASRPAAADSGQITLLVIGFTLILAVLITVVMTASRVFLYQRALSTATDGAAIFAANQLDEAAFYAGGAGEHLPIEAEGARQAVADYVTRTGLAERFDGFGYLVGTDGRVVTVTFTARVALPLVGAVTDRYQDGLTITTTAAAIAPTRR
ncbi:MAG TPA: pilus assembly protein TadG-related protein [Actinomycetes bacterium]|nr:pilus assembly protein TadG-related protein [Actinomycetes bacterium]